MKFAITLHLWVEAEDLESASAATSTAADAAWTALGDAAVPEPPSSESAGGAGYGSVLEPADKEAAAAFAAEDLGPGISTWRRSTGQP